MAVAQGASGGLGRYADLAVSVPDAKRRRHWGPVARHAVLIVLSLWILLPIAWVIVLSMKSLPDGTHRYIFPKNWVHPLWYHYDWILTKGRTKRVLTVALKNSINVTALTLVTSSITATLGGFALVHLRTPGKNLILTILVCSMFVPSGVAAFVGTFKVQSMLGLIDKPWALMFPYTASSVAVSIFIMRGIYQQVPRELLDSATVDGASSLRMLIGIVLPIIRNGIVVVLIVNFSFAWSEFLYAASMMNSQNHKTFPIVIGGSTGGLGTLLWPQIGAMFIIGTIPGLIVFMGAQRWYMKGLQEGALKG